MMNSVLFFFASPFPFNLIVPPQRHPECSWRTENDSSMAIFDCSWHGGYPLPHLQWEDLTAGGAWLGSAVDNEVLEITLNRSLLTDGMEIQCRGKHIAASEDKICHMTLSKLRRCQGSCQVFTTSHIVESQTAVEV